jgi:protein TonB
MSRGFPLLQTADIDNPWRRLPWTLPTALLIWTVALVGLASFMAKPTHQPTELTPIDAQLIEQTVPVAAHEGPAAVPKSKPLPLVRPKQAPENPHTEQNPEPQKAAVTTNPAVSLPAAAVPGASHSTPGEGLAAVTGNASANSGAQGGAYDGKGSTRGYIYASSGARAIVRPMPQIPDDLREGTFNSSALARFHIAVDGSATVELAKPTPNPRLNRILLDSLRKWRFIPAIKNGKPVASTEEIIVKVEVK